MNSNDIFTGIIAASSMILLLATIIIIVILAARKQALMRKFIEAESRHKLAEASFKALRAQMNPHFIFNCLNSIKLYTEQNDAAAASSYLTKFSKLVRAMLDNSRADKVVLSNELESLSLYLDMEAMRFKEKLQYSLTIDNKVDADFIEIPPLLIQPYVENAIWHGIMHQKGGGSVQIKIAQQNEDDEEQLLIQIEDNGIGRAASAALNAGRSMEHKSHGTEVTSERLALMNDNGRSASVVITDLHHADGTAAGTRVIITLPI